jgi:outer membrane lipoprotein-sorting protein
MKFLRLIAISAVALAALPSAMATAQASVNPTSIGILSGTWNCTTHGSMGPSTGTVTFTQAAPDLVQFRWMDKTGKTAGNKGGGVWFYDSKKGEYVAMNAGPGFWGVSRGLGSANAATVTLNDVYPSDPTNGTTTYHFAQSTISFTSDWKKDGKPMHIEQTCTKA